jgi:hypothetical protein
MTSQRSGIFLGIFFAFLVALAGPAVAADQCLGVDPQASVSLAKDFKNNRDSYVVGKSFKGMCHVRMSPTA